MKNLQIILIVFLSLGFFGCKKRNKESIMTIEQTQASLEGTWTLQYIDGYLSNNNGDKVADVTPKIILPNSEVYKFNKDLTYSLTTIFPSSPTGYYVTKGTYKVIESIFGGKNVKHIDLDNTKRINNIINTLDGDVLVIYNLTEGGSAVEPNSNQYKHFSKIK